ncbi:divalent-cation tolerance protein CutA [Candidatus Omnitrophota bacterium]
MSYIAVFITASSLEESERIANGLIDSKLAACVNIIPKIRSIYTWKGKKETSDEFLLIAKTKADIFDALKSKVIELHSYTTPEVVSILISAGNKDYLSWIDENLRPHCGENSEASLE